MKRAFVTRRISSRVETFWQQHRWFQQQSEPERALAAPSFDGLGVGMTFKPVLPSRKSIEYAAGINR